MNLQLQLKILKLLLFFLMKGFFFIIYFFLYIEFDDNYIPWEVSDSFDPWTTDFNNYLLSNSCARKDKKLLLEGKLIEA